MVDYNKQTVAQLRQVLKDRGIPTTGLTRKAQIVEKLEEADQNASGAPQVNDEAMEATYTVQEPSSNASTSDPPQTQPIDDAPPDPVEQVRKENGDDVADKKVEVPGPALSKAGEPATQPLGTSEIAPPPLPIATIDANRETISHIDSDVPPPDQVKAVKQSAEDATMNDEPGIIQPATVFNAAPANPEDVVGPKVTEPADGDMEVASKEVAQDELPKAPGPAAEALRFAQQDEDLSKETSDAIMEDKTPPPTDNEKPSIEKAELLTIPEGSTAETSRLNTEELEADSKKRKRRSHSPSLPSQVIRAKKQKPSQEPVPEVHLNEDDDVVMEQRKPGEDIKDDLNGSNPEATRSPAQQPDTKPSRKEKSDRYKSLVQPSADDSTQESLQDDRPAAPALHPATPALYIRNFMRPLRPEPLRAHLVSLASPPSGSPDASIVKELFLDAMKTHALVLFSTTTAASRVRASLHGSIWPPEGNRKELWVDFIPEDSIEDWIKQEEDATIAEKEGRAAGRPIPAKRFEVIYSDNNTAVFQEVGSGAPADAPRGPRGSTDIRRPSQPVAPTPDTRQDIAASFQTLDQLFSSTAAKPHLYFLPVSDEVAEARLKDLDNETSREWAPDETRKGRGIKTEMKYRYSFDEEDRVVEVGEDMGPWANDYRAGRGRGGFRGGFRGDRGGFRGRGGGSWRG